MIGGMSWESSARYYELVNQLVSERRGGLHSARCVLLSVDFAEIETLQVEGRWDQAGTALAAAAVRAGAAGAELLLLCTNTMHRVAEVVAAAVDTPLLHVADVTADAVEAAGLQTVGLLGTAFTMEQPFLRDRLGSRGLTIITPEESDRALVHGVIYDELCRGVISDRSRGAFVEVIERLIEGGAEGVILGCTEIELLVSQADSPVPVFPTTRLHAEAAVERALG